MALWQRGEALAAHCSTWLDGAEEKLSGGTGPPADRDGHADRSRSAGGRRPRRPRSAGVTGRRRSAKVTSSSYGAVPVRIVVTSLARPPGAPG